MAKFYSSDLPEYQVEPESFEFVQMEGEIADEKFQDKPIGFFKDAMLRFCRSKVSIIAFIGIVIVLLFAVFAPALSRWDYNDQDLNRINLPPKVRCWKIMAFWTGPGGSPTGGWTLWRIHPGIRRAVS